mgnify:CR=1 FL=1|jgi:hypothetical protein
MAKSKDNNQDGSKKIKLSYARLHLELEPAIRLIGEVKSPSNIDVIMNIVKTRKNIDAVLDNFFKARKKITDDGAEKGEDGKPLTRKAVQKNQINGAETVVEVYVFKDDESERKTNLKAQELDQKEVEVEIFPIKYSDIKECENLTPNILLAAGDFVVI